LQAPPFESSSDRILAGSGKTAVIDSSPTLRASIGSRPASVSTSSGTRCPRTFVSSLLSGPQLTDHLLIGAELEYATFPWLYTVDVYRFPGGDDVLVDGESVWTRDSHGDFTRKASHDANGWRMADLGNLVLTAPGHQAWNFMLQPDPTEKAETRWTLEMAFKRSPAPVRR
jgi:hypothetical protein